MLRNVSLFGFARLAPAVINFLSLALFTRVLDKAGYGYYALVIATTSLIIAIGFQWIRIGLVRFLPLYESRREVFLSTLVRGYLYVALAALVIAVGVELFTSDKMIRQLAPIGLLLLWAQAAFELNLDVSVSQLQPIRYGLISFARAAIGVSMAGLLALLGLGAAGVLLGVAIGLLIPLAVTVPRNWRGANPRHSDPEILRHLISYGAPLVATLSLEFVVNASDRFFLGWLRGAETVGAYAVGYDLSQQSLTMLMVTVNLAAWPVVVRALEESGEAVARSRLTQQSLLLASVGLPGAVGLALLAPNIAQVFLGAQFQSAAAKLIPLIAISALLAGAKSYYFDLSFQLGQATSNQIWIMLAAALTNVVCNLLWIPRYDAFGAAYATIAAYGVGLVLSIWRGRFVFRLPLPWNGWGRVLVATAAMAGVLMVLRGFSGGLALLGQVVLAALTFGIVATSLNVLELRANLARFSRRHLIGTPG